MRFKWKRSDGEYHRNRYCCCVDGDQEPCAFVERSSPNPNLWDVVVYAPAFSSLAYTLREGKKMVEDRLREAALFVAVPLPSTAGEGGNGC